MTSDMRQYFYPERRQRLLALAIMAHSHDVAAGTDNPETLVCWATDEDLARLTGLTLRSVQQGLSKMERSDAVAIHDPVRDDLSGPRVIYPRWDRIAGK